MDMERRRKLTLSPNVKEHLICAICTDTFEDPRNLVCGHVFCTKCLDELYKTNPGSQKISCPTCRRMTKLREKGVNGLGRNIPIVGLLDQDLSEESGPSCKRSKRTPTCTEHNQERRDIYCSTCLIFICFQCFQENHSHHITKTRNRFLGELNQKTNDAKQQYQVQLKTLENNLLEADNEKLKMRSAYTSASQSLVREYKAKLARLSQSIKIRESVVDQFKEKGERIKKSLAIAVPKLESKTLLEDLDSEDLTSYVRNIDNVMDLLKTDISIDNLKLLSKRLEPLAVSTPQPGSVPSTSGGAAGQAPQRVFSKSVNKPL